MTLLFLSALLLELYSQPHPPWIFSKGITWKGTVGTALPLNTQDFFPCTNDVYVLLALLCVPN